MTSFRGGVVISAFFSEDTSFKGFIVIDGATEPIFGRMYGLLIIIDLNFDGDEFLVGLFLGLKP